MTKKPKSFRKFIYAFLFVVIIPVVLFYWAEFTGHLINYPAIKSDFAGWYRYPYDLKQLSN